MPVDIHERTSKYTAPLREILHDRGHATNLELLEALQRQFPDVSATTIHRITARMCQRGEVGRAPSGADNVLRYDTNTTPHDHFMCERCGFLRDADLGTIIRPHIEKAIGTDCSISGSLTVSGICQQCHIKEVNL